MGNTNTNRRRSGEDSSLSPTRGDEFQREKFLFHPTDDSEDALSAAIRSHIQDSQYEPVSLKRSSKPDKPSKLPTYFKWEGQGNEVYVAGTFNRWKTRIPLVKSQGAFYTIVDLPEGEHQYKFLVDGQWTHNESEPVILNTLGTSNNVVTVKPTDFEVFEALDHDGETNGKDSFLSRSPPGSYSQEVPERLQDRRSSGPPILPPHLLQVILNKNVPISCEPTLLPEPNHVMLNHLYALSIKDGVMVLSATHRFRKKFVTTLLYKPI